MNSDIKQRLRQEAWSANQELFSRGLALLTFGNASVLSPEAGILAIKPSGIPYSAMQPEDMVLVDLEGRILEGDLRPSSDLPTHLVLYRELPHIGAVTHTHSTHATAWAQAHRSIPCLGTTHADYCLGAIPCTPSLEDVRIQARYEEETGIRILETLQATGCAPDTGMILVGGHGPFTWGKDGAQAVQHAVILEELARMALLTLQLNPDIGELPLALREKHYFRKHGAGAYYGQPVDKAEKGVAR